MVKMKIGGHLLDIMVVTGAEYSVVTKVVGTI